MQFKPIETQAVSLSDKIGDGSKTVEKRIEELTGESFNSIEEWRAWWVENWEYLVWSDKKDLLILDSEAKNEKKAFVPFREISAEDYWFFIGSGRFRNINNIGSFTFFRTRGFVGHDSFNAKINLKEIDDLPAKEKGYKRVVEDFISELKKMEDSLNIINRLVTHEPARSRGLAELEEAIEKLIQKLKLITKQDFGNSDEWKRWYEKNKDRLVLSQDGEGLIVKKSE